jgi:hypothetical protein
MTFFSWVRDTTISDVQLIITGILDSVPPEKLLYIGSLKEGKVV